MVISWVEQNSGHTSMNYYELASPDSVDIFAVANEGIIIHNSGGETWSTSCIWNNRKSENN